MAPLSPDVVRVVDAIYSPARQAVAVRLSHLEIVIFAVSSALQLILLLGYFYSGLAARMREALSRHAPGPVRATLAFVAVSYAGFALALLPLDWYAGFIVPHRFGLSRETPATWFHDWAVADLISIVTIGALAAALGAAVRRFGPRWPVVAAAAAAPLIVFGNAIFPAYVAPLFNTYTPLPPSPLSESILALAKDQGIDASAVYEFDMSRQTTVGNAYVAGLGATARIAVGDNLLRGLKPDEVLYVVAHEMGHYELHHIWWGSLYAWLGAMAAIAVVAYAGGALLRRSAIARATTFDDPAALPLVAALLVCFALVTAPISNGISRSIERQADVFAAQHTCLGDAGVRAFARLGAQGLSVLHPEPFVVWYFFTHPPLDERIAYAASMASTGHGGLTAFPK